MLYICHGKLQPNKQVRESLFKKHDAWQMLHMYPLHQWNSRALSMSVADCPMALLGLLNGATRTEIR